MINSSSNDGQASEVFQNSILLKLVEMYAVSENDVYVDYFSLCSIFHLSIAIQDSSIRLELNIMGIESHKYCLL